MAGAPGAGAGGATPLGAAVAPGVSPAAAAGDSQGELVPAPAMMRGDTPMAARLAPVARTPAPPPPLSVPAAGSAPVLAAADVPESPHAGDGVEQGAAVALFRLSQPETALPGASPFAAPSAAPGPSPTAAAAAPAPAPLRAAPPPAAARRMPPQSAARGFVAPRPFGAVAAARPAAPAALPRKPLAPRTVPVPPAGQPRDLTEEEEELMQSVHDLLTPEGLRDFAEAEDELPRLLRRVEALCIATHTREHMDELERVLKHLVKELGDWQGAKAALRGAEKWLRDNSELR